MYTEEQITNEFKKVYGQEAEFHEGQLEAIQAVLAGQRVLVVQKTGWGKSLVYFLATKLLRAQGKGPTLVFSPLIALMNNQFEAARKFFPETTSIRLYNSSVDKDYKNYTVDLLKENKIDVLFITPESLTNEEFNNNILPNIYNIGLLVIDEAHCISDWGHDFRPDYMNIVKITDLLPHDAPVLATTATANDRVINDIETQLRYKNDINNKMLVLWGSLQRESLFIQVVKLADFKAKLAWIKDHVLSLQKRVGGVGIIYCTTINDCKLVASWLQKCYPTERVAIYNGQLNKDLRVELEKDFLYNKIDILVATNAFGMGIDKPNIGFVIHCNKPKNVIEYYQQIGRAGRGKEMPLAYAILLTSDDDDNVNNFFIRSAFASYDEMMNVFHVIKENPGCTQGEIIANLNYSAKLINKILKYLVAKDAIRKYYTSKKMMFTVINEDWQPDEKHIENLTQLRYEELGDMSQYIASHQCHMQYITGLLNDRISHTCGHCAVCKPEQALSESYTDDSILTAGAFVDGFNYDVDIRKKWADNKWISKNELICGNKIFVLTKYGTGNYGKLVKEGKYGCKPAYFADELIDAAVRKLEQIVKSEDIRYLVPIPSLNHPELVSNFTKRLANKLNCQYLDVLGKNSRTEQKNLHNAVQQQQNIETTIYIKENMPFDGNLLLIDDMVDSKWTLTVAASKLLRYAIEHDCNCRVFAFALANSVNSED